MKLDRATLRWAKPENLQRLARALRIALPPIPRDARLEGWKRQAIRALVRVTCPEDT